jgi:hypothetical protein
VKKKIELALAGLLALALGGCPRPFEVPEPGPDYALIGDHMIEGTGDFDYALIEIDGRPVKKEMVPFGVDMNARTVADIGPHTFKVNVWLHARRSNVPQEKVFTATVKGGKTYFVGTSDGLPVLMEQKQIARKSSG